MKVCRLICACVAMVACTPLVAGVLLTEGFENGLPAGWVSQPINGVSNWVVTVGSDLGLPAAPHAGASNACFYTDGYQYNTAILWTPPLDFGSSPKGKVSFWLANAGFFGDLDELYVVTKTSPAGPITPLALFNSDLPAWAEQSVILDTVSTSLYVGFWATQNWGFGVCVDDVTIQTVDTLDPSDFLAQPFCTEQIDLSWMTNSSGNPVVIATNGIPVIGTPADGTLYAPGDAIPGGGGVLYAGGDLSYSHMGLSADQAVFYKIWAVNTATQHSPGITAVAKTFATRVAALPYVESFEGGFGAWEGALDDDFAWSLISGPTPSSGTGPAGAAVGTNYVYTEASVPNSPFKLATLSACFSLTGTPIPRLAFAYHMYGDDMGLLAVDLYQNGMWENVWSKFGQQQISEFDPWVLGFASLGKAAGASNVLVRFRGITGGGFASDMAVDFVNVFNADPAILINPTPQFESGARLDTVEFELQIINDTGCPGPFTASYTSDWPYDGPTALGTLDFGQSTDIVVSVSIPGTAELFESSTTTVEIVSNPGGYNSYTGMATLVASFNTPGVETITPTVGPPGEELMLGVAYDGTYLWVSGAGSDSATPPNYIYQFDLDGNLITQVMQQTSSGWGWRDLAFDGTYLYGSDSPTIDQIDPASGQTTDVINVVGGPGVCRGLAYDPSNDVFYTANFDSPIYCIDRSGNVVTQYPNTLFIYGLGFDPETAMLWAWSQDGNGCQASQFDTVAGAFTGISFDGVLLDPLQLAGGAALGMVGSNKVFFGMHQADPDTVVGYGLQASPLLPPAVTTLPPQEVLWDYGDMNGRVNPGGLTTRAWFEYGPAPMLLGDVGDSSGFPNMTPAFIVPGSGPVTLRRGMLNLQPNQPQQFRVVAANALGTNYGNTVMFSTLPYPDPLGWRQVPDTNDFSSASQIATNYPFIATSADDFMFPTNVPPITYVRWWAAEWNGTPPHITPYGWQIAFYTNAPPCGVGGLVGAFLVDAADANEMWYADDLGEEVYSYYAKLDTPFPLQPGVRYWMDVRALLDAFPQIGWQFAIVTNGCPGQIIFPAAGIPDWTENWDYAFELFLAPEPGTLVVGFGLALLALRCRRR